MSDTTKYSDVVAGGEGNYRWGVRFDKTRRHIGIDQWQDGEVMRVLLSPAQVKELVKFCGKQP